MSLYLCVENPYSPSFANPSRAKSMDESIEIIGAGRLFVRKFEPRGSQGRSKAPRGFSFGSSQAAPSIRNGRSPGQQRDALWQPLFPSCSLWFKSRWLCAATRSEVSHFLAGKLCGTLEKYFILRELHDEDCACFRPGWVVSESRDGAMCDGPIMRCFAMVFAFLANFAFQPCDGCDVSAPLRLCVKYAMSWRSSRLCGSYPR